MNAGFQTHKRYFKLPPMIHESAFIPDSTPELTVWKIGRQR